MSCTKPNWELGEKAAHELVGLGSNVRRPASVQTNLSTISAPCVARLKYHLQYRSRVLYLVVSNGTIYHHRHGQTNKRCASTGPDSDLDPDPNPLTEYTDYTTPELDGAYYGATQPHTNPILENQQLLREYGNHEWNDEETSSNFLPCLGSLPAGDSPAPAGWRTRYSTCACVNSILRRRSVRISQEGCFSCANDARQTQINATQTHFDVKCLSVGVMYLQHAFRFASQDRPPLWSHHPK